MKDKVVVTCVKWGTEFSDDYVRILRDSVARNTTVPHDFICFSDTKIDGVDTIALEPGLTGWWNKMLLFKGDVEANHIVYFDLDTVITGNIDWLMNYRGKMLGIENLGTKNRFEDGTKYQRVFQSGVMAWQRDFGKQIWNIFEEQKENVINGPVRGDGEFLHVLFCLNACGVDLLQYLWPGKLKSYKYEVYETGLDDETAIVCFHGTPRPHEAIDRTTYPWGVEFLPSLWIADHWRTGE